ncbi:MAG TPA: hypothetical protein VHJ58_09730 [Vicinamibacterales bacterium]|jgi:hypothetical protein|nr:hypothetical protein [Vicinamibacterales bacterium]
MLPRIAITRTWSDDDVAQLTFEVCDGVSVFTNEAYASLDWGATAAAALRTLGRQIHGGLFNLEAGEGGPEYASGSFRARFHYHKPNQLLISTIQQGDFFRFKGGQVAPTATMFLRTEPSLLDQFIAALPALDAPDGGQAVLQCVPLPDDA